VIELKNMNALAIGLFVLFLISPLALAAEEGQQSETIELLEMVAVVFSGIATILAFLVAMRVGGEMGTALKVVAVGVACMGVIRELFEILGNDTVSEAFEILGGLILLIGFYLLYRSVK